MRRAARIQWSADYTIEGDTFVWTERESGTVRRVLGYPTRTIVEMS